MKSNFNTQNALTILFEWDGLSFNELKFLCTEMNIKNVRWLATNHPDNKTRENLFRLSNVVVGEMTTINFGLFIHSLKPMVEIGARCALAANISLVPDSNPNMSSLGYNRFVKENYIKKGIIVIQDDVWIGSNVVILPGITIGNNSIIGAGSIVTKSIPPYSVAKGTPAKVSKTIPFE